MSTNPNDDQIMHLLKQLSTLVDLRRSQLSQAEYAQVIQEYHDVLTQLWQLPWDRDLDPDMQLPRDEMPAYYLDYWAQNQYVPPHKQ